MEQRDKWGFEVKKPFQIQTQMLESVWVKITGMDKKMGTIGIARRDIPLTGTMFMLFSLGIFFQLIQQPTNALNEIQFMPSINVVQVWAQGCHSQGVLSSKYYKPKSLI